MLLILLNRVEEGIRVIFDTRYINLSNQLRLLSTLVQEMAWRQIGTMPFLGSMLICDRVEHNEQISVNYFALFSHFHRQKYHFIRHIYIFSITKFLRCFWVRRPTRILCTVVSTSWPKLSVLTDALCMFLWSSLVSVLLVRPKLSVTKPDVHSTTSAVCLPKLSVYTRISAASRKLKLSMWTYCCTHYEVLFSKKLRNILKLSACCVN